MPYQEKAKLRLRELAANALHYSGASRILQMGEEHHWRVLMYHRVVDSGTSPYPLQPGMYVTPQTFAMQMEYLSEHARVVSLDELAHDVAQNKEIPPRTVALTFDDGWTDVSANILPVLQRFNFPATVFLVTSFIGTNETLWNDKVALALTCLRQEGQYHTAVSSRIREKSEISAVLFGRIARILAMTGEEGFPEALDSLIEEL